jgi:hypothetical protein
MQVLPPQKGTQLPSFVHPWFVRRESADRSAIANTVESYLHSIFYWREMHV